MRRFVSILVMMMLAFKAYSQVSVESKIDSISILIGEQAHMYVEVTAHKGANIVFPSYKRRQMLVPGVEVLNYSQGDTSTVDGLIKIKRVYTLTSFDEHLYAIPSMSVKVDGKTYKSNQLALKVLTCDVDTLHPEKFYPPKGIQTPPFMWSEWSPLFCVSLLGLLFIIGGLYLYVRLRQNKPIIVKIKIIKHIPPHRKALDNIQRLKAGHFDTEASQKDYYTQLTDTLRLYIKERFGFNALEMTSSEILSKLNEIGDEKMIAELRDLFTTADLVKFAKYSTHLSEKDLNLVNAINFIDQTKREDTPTEERIVPKLSDDDVRARNSRLAIKTLLCVSIVLSLVVLGYLVYYIYQLLG